MSDYSYGFDSQRRYVLCEVVPNGLMDPEQSGRIQVRVIGYDGKNITDEQCIWARPLHPITSAMDGGIGGAVTGATEKTIFRAEFTGPQSLALTHVVGNSGQKKDGSDDLDYSNADTNPLSRDADTHDGGDKRKSNDASSLSDPPQWDNKSITLYAKDEAPSPSGNPNSKDADNNGYSIGNELYA